MRDWNATPISREMPKPFLERPSLTMKCKSTSAFVEALVNAVVSKRFAKKQQMRWTRRASSFADPRQDARRNVAIALRALVSRLG